MDSSFSIAPLKIDDDKLEELGLSINTPVNRERRGSVFDRTNEQRNARSRSPVPSAASRVGSKSPRVSVLSPGRVAASSLAVSNSSQRANSSSTNTNSRNNSRNVSAERVNTAPVAPSASLERLYIPSWIPDSHFRGYSHVTQDKQSGVVPIVLWIDPVRPDDEEARLRGIYAYVRYYVYNDRHRMTGTRGPYFYDLESASPTKARELIHTFPNDSKASGTWGKFALESFEQFIFGSTKIMDKFNKPSSGSKNMETYCQIVFDDFITGRHSSFYLELQSRVHVERAFHYVRQWCRQTGSDLIERVLGEFYRLFSSTDIRCIANVGSRATMYDSVGQKQDVWFLHDHGRQRSCTLDKSIHLGDVVSINEQPRTSPDENCVICVKMNDGVIHTFSHSNEVLLRNWASALYTEHAREGPIAIQAGELRNSVIKNEQISGSRADFNSHGLTPAVLPGPPTSYDASPVYFLKQARTRLSPLLTKSITATSNGILFKLHSPYAFPLLLQFQVKMGRLMWSKPSEGDHILPTLENSISLMCLTNIKFGKNNVNFALCSSIRNLSSEKCVSLSFLPSLITSIIPTQAFSCVTNVTNEMLKETADFQAQVTSMPPGELLLEAEDAQIAKVFVMYLHALTSVSPVVRKSRNYVAKQYTTHFTHEISNLKMGEELYWNSSISGTSDRTNQRVVYASGRLYICPADSGICLQSFRGLTMGIHSTMENAGKKHGLDPNACFSILFDPKHNKQIIEESLIGIDTQLPENNPNSPFCKAYKHPLADTQNVNVQFYRREQALFWYEALRSLLHDSGLLPNMALPRVSAAQGPIYTIAPRTRDNLAQDAMNGRIFVMHGNSTYDDRKNNDLVGINGVLSIDDTIENEGDIIAEYEGYTDAWLELGDAKKALDDGGRLFDEQFKQSDTSRTMLFSTSGGLVWSSPSNIYPLKHVERSWVGNTNQMYEENDSELMKFTPDKTLLDIRQLQAQEQSELRHLNQLLGREVHEEELIRTSDRLTQLVHEEVVLDGKLQRRLKHIRLYSMVTQHSKENTNDKPINPNGDAVKKTGLETDERAVALSTTYKASDAVEEEVDVLASPLNLDQRSNSINNISFHLALNDHLQGPARDWARAVQDVRKKSLRQEARQGKNRFKQLVKAGKAWVPLLGRKEYDAIFSGIKVEVYTEDEEPVDRLIYWAQGRLCVEDLSKTSREATENSYKMDAVDVLLGKHTATFHGKYGSKADPLCCMTLLVTNDYDEDIEVNIKFTKDVYMQHYIDTLEHFFTELQYKIHRSEEPHALYPDKPCRFISFYTNFEEAGARGSIRQHQTQIVRDGALFYYFTSPYDPPKLVKLLLRGGSLILAPHGQIIPSHSIQQAILSLTYESALKDIGTELCCGPFDAATIYYESFTFNEDDDDASDGVAQFILTPAGFSTRLYTWFLSFQNNVKLAGLVISPELQSVGGLVGYRLWSVSNPTESHTQMTGPGDIVLCHPYGHTVRFFVEASRIYMSDARADYQHKFARTIYLRDIIMIQCGLISYAFDNIEEKDHGIDVRTFSLTIYDPFGTVEEIGFECESKQQLQSILFTLLAQMNTLGLYIESKHNSYTPGSQFYIWSSARVHSNRISADNLTKQVAEQSVHQSFSELSNSLISPFLRVLIQGEIFTGLAISKDGKIQKSPISFFLTYSLSEEEKMRDNSRDVDYSRKSEEKQWWSPPGKRVCLQNCCLFMSQVTNIYVGKHTPVFRSKLSSDLDARCCFSILTKSDTFDFVAPSPLVLKQWCLALVMVLQAKKKQYGLKLPNQGLVLSTDNIVLNDDLVKYVNTIRREGFKKMVLVENDIALQQSSIYLPHQLSMLSRSSSGIINTAFALQPVTASHYLALQQAMSLSIDRSFEIAVATQGIKCSCKYLYDFSHQEGEDEPVIQYLDPLSNSDEKETYDISRQTVGDKYLASISRLTVHSENAVLFYHATSPKDMGCLYWCIVNDHTSTSNADFTRVIVPTQCIPLHTIVNLSLSYQGPSLSITSPALRGIVPQDTMTFQYGLLPELVEFALAIANIHKRFVDPGVVGDVLKNTRGYGEVLQELTICGTSLGLILAEEGRNEIWDKEQETTIILTDGLKEGEKEYGYPYSLDGGHMLKQPQVTATLGFEVPMYGDLALTNNDKTGYNMYEELLNGYETHEYPYINSVVLQDFPIEEDIELFQAKEKKKINIPIVNITLPSFGRTKVADQEVPTINEAFSGIGELLEMDDLVTAEDEEEEALFAEKLEEEKKEKWVQAQVKLEAQRQKAIEVKMEEENEAKRIQEEIAQYERELAIAMEVEIEYVYEEESEEEPDILHIKPASKVHPSELNTDKVRPPSIWEIIAARAKEANEKLAHTERELMLAGDSDDEQYVTRDEDASMPASKRQLYEESLNDAAEEERVLEALLLKAREARLKAEERLARDAEKKQKRLATTTVGADAFDSNTESSSRRRSKSREPRLESDADLASVYNTVGEDDYME